MNFKNISIVSKIQIFIIVSVLSFSAFFVIFKVGLDGIKKNLEELIFTIDVERYSYETILEEKNYLLNSNKSISNFNEANVAFENAKLSIAVIFEILDRIDSEASNDFSLQMSKKARANTQQYKLLYIEGVALLDRLKIKQNSLHKTGTMAIDYVKKYIQNEKEKLQKNGNGNKLEKLNTAADILQHAYEVRINEHRYSISPDIELIDSMESHFKLMFDKLQYLKQISSKDDELQKIKSFFNVVYVYRNNAYDWIELNKKLMTKVLPKMDILGKQVKQNAVKASQSTIKQMYEKREDTLTMLSYAIICIFLFILFFSIFLLRTIIYELKDFKMNLLSFFKYINKESNDVLILREPNNEIGQLAKVINENIKKTKSNMEKEYHERLKKEREKDKLFSEQSKMASMGEMVGNIAHQWRQPLSVVTATASGAKLKKEIDALNDDDFIESMDGIVDTAKYLSDTIDDFTNFIKGTTVCENFKLIDMIERTYRLLEGSIKNHNIDIVIDEIDKDVTVKGAPNELTQVLMNLYNNAKDAMNEKDIDIYNRFIFIEVSTKSNSAIIKVKDNAGGIPDNVLPKIFEQYFTTKEESSGTGLGLHMSYELITRSMNGTIDVQNETYEYKGKEYSGAQFVITLPLAEEGK